MKKQVQCKYQISNTIEGTSHFQMKKVKKKKIDEKICVFEFADAAANRCLTLLIDHF